MSKKEEVQKYLRTHAVNCETEEEAREMLDFLDGLGFVWISKEKLTSFNHWSQYGESTAYSFEPYFGLFFTRLGYDPQKEKYIPLSSFREFKERFMKREDKIEKGSIIRFRKDATLYDLVKDDWDGCQIDTLTLLKKYRFDPMVVSHGEPWPEVDGKIINENVIELVSPAEEYKEYTVEELEERLGEKIKIKGKVR